MKKRILTLSRLLLFFILISHGISIVAAENENNICIDMKLLTIMKGNGYDEIEGGIVTETGKILLYGWTTSSMWEDLSYKNTFASCRDALVVMVSSEGTVQWIITDGDTDSQCMYSFVGAAMIDDRIVLCHRKLMDYTWEEVYGITVMNCEGTILKKYDFEDSLIVRDTCSTGTSLLVCGSYIQGEYRIPFIYAITASGEHSWEYTDQPISWLDGKYTECSFESVVGNNKGITIGVLDHGSKYVQLITLNNTGEEVNSSIMERTTVNDVWLSDEYYGIYGYTMGSFTISYADFGEHQHKKIVEPQSYTNDEQITRLLKSRNSMYYLITRNMIPSGIYRADQLCRIGLNNPYPEISYSGGAISEDNRILTLFGNTWEQSRPNIKYVIVTRGNIPMQ